MEILDKIPSGGYVIAIGLTLAMFFLEKFDKRKIQRAKMENATEDRIVALFKEENQKLRDAMQEKDREHRESSEQNRKRNEDLAREISKLQGVLEEKDKKNKEYLEILQNRDPKLEKLMSQVAEGLVNIHNFMKVYVGEKKISELPIK